jgi:drug/metabolite transporter (DMT)-like permease
MLKNLSLFSLVVAVWGSTWFGIKLQGGVVPIELSAGYRFLLAAACLFVISAATGRRLRFPPRTHARFAAIGVLQYGVNYILFYHASEYMVSGLMSVVFALSASFNLINARVFLKRPIRPGIAVAAGVGALGLCIAFWPDIRRNTANDGMLLGLALSLVGTLSFSLGNTLSAKVQAADVPVMSGAAWSMLYGGAWSTLFALSRGAVLQFDWSTVYVGSLLYLSIIGSAVGFVAYLTLLGRVGPGRAAFTTLLFPLVALGFSAALEHYHWNPYLGVGVVIVLLSNATMLRRR